MEFLFFLITMACAFAGGFVGYKLKLPGGALLGSIIGVVALNLTVQRSHYYTDIKIPIQMLSGAMIASKIGKKDIEEIKKIILPTVFLLASMIVLNLVFGGSIYAFSSLDVATSLFASAPGGMSDMAIISADLGANQSYVAILQLARILIIFIFMPTTFRSVLKNRKIEKRVETEEGVKSEKYPETKMGEKGYIKKFILLLLTAAAGGLVLYFLKVPAGALTGAMLASAVLCVTRGKVQFPPKLRFVMQVFAGALLGVGIDWACVMTFPELFVPILIMLIGIFAFVFATGFLMHKLFKLDLAVCLLSSTPGGVQEMSLLSEDLNADTPKIAIMQTVRLMSVIILFPTMLRMITLMITG